MGERALISECVNDIDASDTVPYFPECPQDSAFTQEALLLELDRISNLSAKKKSDQTRMRIRLYEFSLGLKEEEANSLYTALNKGTYAPEVHLTALKTFYGKVGGFKLAGDTTDSEKRLKSVFSNADAVEMVKQFLCITDGKDAKRYAEARLLLNLDGSGESKTPIAVRKENQKTLIEKVQKVWGTSNDRS